MAKMQTTDLRITNLHFEDIPIGEMFTQKGNQKLYIKIPIVALVIKVIEEEEEYNAIYLPTGELTWFDEDEEVESINEIYITMK